MGVISERMAARANHGIPVAATKATKPTAKKEMKTGHAVEAGLGIVLDAVDSEQFLKELERRVSFKAKFAKETKDRKAKLDTMRTDIATAGKKTEAAQKATATGEADQDYDHAFYDKIVKDLAKAGFKGATHREFDKYQGVYIRVPGVGKYWGVEAFTRGVRDDADKKFKYDAAQLYTPDGDSVSANRGDYFMMNPGEKMEGYTLVLTLTDGTKKEIEDPTIGDFPKDNEVKPYTFQFKKGTSKEVVVFQSEQTGNKGEVVGDDTSDFIDLVKEDAKGKGGKTDATQKVESRKFEVGTAVRPTQKLIDAVERAPKSFLAMLLNEFNNNDGVLEVKEPGTVKQGWVQVGRPGQASPIYGVPNANMIEPVAANPVATRHQPVSAKPAETAGKKQGQPDIASNGPRTHANKAVAEQKEYPELEKGKKVEAEHGATYDNIKSYYAENGEFPPFDMVTEWIATDHIKEFADYYEALDKMEKELKAKKTAKKVDAISSNTEKAINKAVNEYWKPKLGERGKRLINWLNSDLYYGPYAAGTTDEEDNPDATYPGFTSAIDELRDIIDAAGGFQDMWYDNDSGQLMESEPEGYTDEETGEFIEPFLEETYLLEGRDVAKYVLGKELVSYVR